MGYRIREIHLDENEVEKELERIEVHPVGVSIMKNKGKIRFLKIENVDVRAANILKQEMLSIGGEVALSRDAFYLGKNECRAIVMGTVHHFNKLIPKLKLQPFGLKDIAEEMEKIVHRTPIKATRIGDTLFEWGERTYIMGIINLTPDSFSGDGLYSRERFVDNALGYACLLREWGADIIDIGGESTRPGSREVPYEEERRRVMPVLRKLVKDIDCPISVDTSKWEIAKEALHLGASMINDVWGLKKDKEMAKIVAKYNVPVVIMHSIDGKGGPPPEGYYKDVVSDVYFSLKERIEFALENGIKPHNIIVDPGIGFGKGLKENIKILKKLSEFKTLGYPLLVGVSRKSFIGEILNLPPEERVEGTIGAVITSIAKGADIVRVHDVKEIKRAIRVADRILK